MSRTQATFFHLILVFSFLLLSTPVFGQSGLQRKDRQQSLSDLQTSYSPISNSHFMATWVSGNFSIAQGGSWINWSEGSDPQNNFDWLWFNYGQGLPETGFDVGVGRVTSTMMVADLATENYNGYQSPAYNRTLDFEFADNLNPTTPGSFWWMGPKTIIYSFPNWEDKDVPDFDRLDGEYECYIVNNSSDTREQLANRLGLEWRGGAFYEGHFYHHYTTNLVFTGSDGLQKSINQVWTIKHVFTNEDSVPVNQIQGDWMLDGLVPWYFYNLGWKINLETSGQFGDGFGLFFDLVLPSND